MPATTTILNGVLRAALLLVILAEVNSLWIGLTDIPRYLATFPDATGPLYVATLVTSLAAGANAVMIWLRRTWAIWLNVFIGPWSVVLIELVNGPRSQQAVVLVAWALTTGLALVLFIFRAANSSSSPR
jgi:hypothetical protein